MPQYRVRKGQQLPHQGQVLEGGTIVELPRRLAREFPHLVDEIDGSGVRILAEPPAWRQALEGRREHEKVSILADQRAIAVERTVTAQLITEDAAAAAKQAAADYLTAKAVVDDIDAAMAALTAADADKE